MTRIKKHKILTVHPDKLEEILDEESLDGWNVHAVLPPKFFNQDELISFLMVRETNQTYMRRYD